ncbi:hypothetical protein BJY04DRAFT_191838 [Aspergillus karnatakaensis]|uniref:uncharacterized protein n=1 Tax=Aspergillus karnatakaensis TaxID=1810916 RepID=UPI003CCE289B
MRERNPVSMLLIYLACLYFDFLLVLLWPILSFLFCFGGFFPWACGIVWFFLYFCAAVC